MKEHSSDIEGMEHESVGDYLKELRLRAQLTQEQVTTQAGVTIATLSSIENNRRRPSARSVNKLAAAYHADAPGILRRFHYSKPEIRAAQSERVETVGATSEAFPVTADNATQTTFSSISHARTPSGTGESPVLLPTYSWESNPFQPPDSKSAEAVNTAAQAKALKLQALEQLVELAWLYVLNAPDSEAASWLVGAHELPLQAQVAHIVAYQRQQERVLLKPDELQGLQSHLKLATDATARLENIGTFDADTHRAIGRRTEIRHGDEEIGDENNSVAETQDA